MGEEIIQQADIGAMPEEVIEPRIVTAVAVSANTGEVMSGGGSKSTFAQLIEKAMSDAVQKCYDEGRLEVEEIKADMQAAREQIEAWYHAEVAKIVAAQQVQINTNKPAPEEEKPVTP